MIDDLALNVKRRPAALDGPRRAKYILNRADMHAVLGLPDDVRVVTMYTFPDPEAVCVVVEGDGVEPHGGQYEATVFAWKGLVEAPPVSWQWQVPQ